VETKDGFKQGHRRGPGAFCCKGTQKLLLTLLACILPIPAFSEVELRISTQNLIPPLSSQIRNYRLGLANTLGQDFWVYTGEKIYLLGETGTERGWQLGLGGGIQLMLRSAPKYRFDLLTQDGYLTAHFEFKQMGWGGGLTFTHHSAHLGDGWFKTRDPFISNQNFVSVDGMFELLSNVKTYLQLDVFLTDMPQNRIMSHMLGLSWTPTDGLLAELSLQLNLPFARGASQGAFFDFIRTKLSLGNPSSLPKWVPYVLLHSGRHYAGQRFFQHTTQILVGLEFDL
jgi:hypothetical protein